MLDQEPTFRILASYLSLDPNGAPSLASTPQLPETTPSTLRLPNSTIFVTSISSPLSGPITMQGGLRIDDAAFGSKVSALSLCISEVFAQPFEDPQTSSVPLEDLQVSSETVTQPDLLSAVFEGRLDPLIDSLREFLNRLELVSGLEGMEDLLSQSPAPHPWVKV